MRVQTNFSAQSGSPSRAANADRQLYAGIGVVLVASLLLAGCAQMQTQTANDVAQQTMDAVGEVRACASAAGASVPGAESKAPADRSNQEQALIEAEESARDVAAIQRQIEGDQARLDGLLEPQHNADQSLTETKAFQAEFRRLFTDFYTEYNELAEVARALAEETRDPNEAFANSRLDDAWIEGEKIIVPPFGLASLLADAIEGDTEESRLRRSEANLVRNMRSTMESMRQSLEANGFDSSPLSSPIAQATTFLGQFENPERTLDVRSMIHQMEQALDFMNGSERAIADRVATAQGDVDSVAQQTADAFSSQRQHLADLNRAHDQASAALTACLGNPFGAIPSVPNWDSCFWDICSP